MTTTQQPTLVHVTELVEGERITLNLNPRYTDMSAGAIAQRLDGSGRTFVGLTDEHDGAFCIQYRENEGKSVSTTAGLYQHAWALRPEQPEGEVNAERPASEQWAGADASARVSSILRGVTLNTAEAEALVDIVRSRAVGGEAMTEGEDEPDVKVPEAQIADGRGQFRREDAIVLAVQALGGTEHVLSVVDVARQIEAYVNESEQPTYPHPDGETIVLGPGVFASDDRKVLNWDGVNYVQQDTIPADLPKIIRTAEDAALVWPVGTQVGPDYEGSMWQMTEYGWRWLRVNDITPVPSSLSITDYLRGGLTVKRFGTGA